MSITEIATAAERLTPEQRRELLARLAFELTIAARTTYDPGSGDIAEPRQLRAFNEIQHRVTSSLLDILGRRKDENWVWPVVAEFAHGAGIASEVAGACSRAFRSVMVTRQ
jgi:hypothetical protein